MLPIYCLEARGGPDPFVLRRPTPSIHVLVRKPTTRDRLIPGLPRLHMRRGLMGCGAPADGARAGGTRRVVPVLSGVRRMVAMGLALPRTTAGRVGPALQYASSELGLAGSAARRRASGTPPANHETLLPPRQQVVPSRCARVAELADSEYNWAAGRVSGSPSDAAGAASPADPLTCSSLVLPEEQVLIAGLFGDGDMIEHHRPRCGRHVPHRVSRQSQLRRRWLSLFGSAPFGRVDRQGRLGVAGYDSKEQFQVYLQVEGRQRPRQRSLWRTSRATRRAMLASRRGHPQGRAPIAFRSTNIVRSTATLIGVDARVLTDNGRWLKRPCGCAAHGDLQLDDLLAQLYAQESRAVRPHDRAPLEFAHGETARRLRRHARLAQRKFGCRYPHEAVTTTRPQRPAQQLAKRPGRVSTNSQARAS